MQKFKLLVLICTILLSRFAMGQCPSQERPPWVDGFFQEKTNSYIETVTAKGPTEEEARNKAAQIVIERRSLATGQRVQVRVQTDNFVVTGNDELTVKARIIDEYCEWYGPGEYRVSLLVQTAKNPTFDFEQVNVTNKYPFSPRVFVPGMAQIHKGNTGKGVFFISTTIVSVSSAVFCEMKRSDNMRKSQETTNLSIIKEYRNRADNWTLYRNVSIGAAIGLYTWNVIDGCVAKGKKQVKVTPFACLDGQGVTLCFNF